MSEIVPFKKEDVKEYLDSCIIYWRKRKYQDEMNGSEYTPEMAIYYIDAFQSVRISLFGELLSLEEGEEV